jgi:hypothetical protein
MVVSVSASNGISPLLVPKERRASSWQLAGASGGVLSRQQVLYGRNSRLCVSF